MEKLLNKLMEEARQEKEAVIKQARRKAAALERALKKKAQDEAGQYLALEKSRQEQQRQKELTAAALAARHDVLKVREELLDSVYTSVLGRLHKDPALARRFFETSLGRLAPGEHRLLIAKDLAAVLDQDWVAQTAKRLKKSGRNLIFEGYGKGSYELKIRAEESETTISPENVLDVHRAELDTMLNRLLFEKAKK